MSAFAAVLKTYRTACRTSMSQLAIEAGFDHSYISRLESGHRAPTREAVNRIATALGLDAPARDHLLASAGYLPKRTAHVFTGEPVLAELLDLLQDDTIPADSRANVRAMLRLLADQLTVQRPASLQEAA
jgi:transcriptional regulator with XRE-family HTH domain